MAEQSQVQRTMEVHHVEGELAEFRSIIPGERLGLEIGRKLWTELGTPGQLHVVIYAVGQV